MTLEAPEGARRRKRYRKHQGTIADGVGVGESNMVLRVVGHRPKFKPYLHVSSADHVATVDDARSLRSLAHHILKAIGDE